MAGKEVEAGRLEKAATQPDFWNDRAKAQRMMSRLTAINEETALWRDIEERIDSIEELVDLSIAEGDSSLEEQINTDLGQVQNQLESLEVRLAFGGKYDEEAAILTIHAGAGGTESQDWVEMLMRMYLRWGERSGRATKVLDLSPGEEAGIKSVTLEFDGALAYGYLKSERGVH
ncbi:MAG: PCRF domain-containing protein, partial [Chloroflexi bacterium]|nr:PCRF domain-containing protein [Chloroflexota bacterium]